MTDKLNIANEMREFDRKNRQFYDELTDEERRKFSNFLMIRWGSAVEGSRDLQEFYVIATNERLNRHFFNLSRHPRLQWLLATTVSPGLGTHRHNWIAPKKRESSGARRRRISEIFPQYKEDEVDVMMKLISDSELNAYERDCGKDKK